MKKIVISGYYGFDNLGDEAVLESVLNNIRGSMGELHITVLSANPAATEKLYGVHAVKRISPVKVLKALWNCDLLISGGGSLLQDVTGRLSIFYYLSLIAMGKLMGKKVMIYSQGIGPIRKPFNRFMTRHILGWVDAITVREPNSRSDLIEMGIEPEHVTITADPVISLSPQEDPLLMEWLRHTPGYIDNAPLIGFAFRGQDMAFGAAEKLTKVIRSLRETLHANVLLIPYYSEQDGMVLDSLERLAEGLVIPVRKRLSVKEMLSLTAQLDVLVGTRLHSLIVSAVCGTPMVAVSYDPKIEYFMGTIHRAAFGDVRTFEPETLLAQIMETLNAGKEPMKAVSNDIALLRGNLHQNEAVLKQLLTEGGSMSEKSVKIFGVRIDRVDMDEAFNRFLVLLNRERTAVIYTPNTEMVMMAEKDREFKDVLNTADMVIPDGIGLIYASRIHNLGLRERVPGIELMDRILKYCNATRRSIFLFGGKPGIADMASYKILEKYPNIVIKGIENGYFGPEDEDRIIDSINEAKPDVLFVALGAPKQEKWVAKYRKILNAHVTMGVGGSLDVYAGSVKRAPVFFQKLGIEWLHRLLKEPSRIGRMMALPKFMIKVLTTRNISG